jgi:hypothetical protein
VAVLGKGEANPPQNSINSGNRSLMDVGSSKLHWSLSAHSDEPRQFAALAPWWQHSEASCVDPQSNQWRSDSRKPITGRGISGQILWNYRFEMEVLWTSKSSTIFLKWLCDQSRRKTSSGQQQLLRSPGREL